MVFVRILGWAGPSPTQTFRVTYRHCLSNLIQYKNPRQSQWLCQGRIIIRGATLIRDRSRSCRSTVILPATDVCPHVMEYSTIIVFDHALNGPFDDPLFLPGSQPSGLSVWRVIAFTSVSTVYGIVLYIFYLVKHFLFFF